MLPVGKVEGQNEGPQRTSEAVNQGQTDGLIDGLFVAAVTADGRRDFHLYASPQSDVEQWVRRVFESHPHHTTTFFRNEDPDHHLYEILQREGKAANADRQTVDALSQNGADLQRSINSTTSSTFLQRTRPAQPPLTPKGTI
jgi:hypothetical protein